MKADALTIAVVVFIVGILASSIGVTDAFQADAEPVPGLQQGITTAN